MKEFSIIICTYNGEKTLPKVLDSVLELDEIETLLDTVLIVNNASKDNTQAVIDQYCAKYPRFIFTEFEERQGLAHARTHFKSLKSKWVIFLDDDNVVNKHWLTSMNSFVSHDKRIGVANSACIAVPDGVFSTADLDVLYAICPAIACTHFSLEDYFAKKPSFIRFPFGAGMFVLREPLMNYLASGWTNNVGRKGDDLFSGEDGEIAKAVINQGFHYSLNTDTYLFHLIPHKRIEKDYVTKLSYGLSLGYVNSIKTKKNYKILRIAIFLRNSILILLHPIKQMFTTSPRKKLINKLEIESRKTINKLL